MGDLEWELGISSARNPMECMYLLSRTVAYAMRVPPSSLEPAKGAQAMKRARLLDFLSAASFQDTASEMESDSSVTPAYMLMRL